MANDLTKPNKNEIDDNWISLRAAKNPRLDGLEYRPVYSKKGWNIIHFKDHNGDYGMRIFFEELWSQFKSKPRGSIVPSFAFVSLMIVCTTLLEN